MMKKIHCGLIAAMATMFMLAGCSDEPTGSVAYVIQFGNTAGVDSLQIEIGGVSAEAEVSGTTSLTGILEEVPTGDLVAVVTAFASESSEAAGATSAAVSVSEDQLSNLHLSFEGADVLAINLEGSTKRGAEMTLTADVGDKVTPIVLWSDNCNGTFTDPMGASVTWANDAIENCTISAQAMGSTSAPTTLDVYVSGNKGDVEILAGGICQFPGNYYDDFSADGGYYDSGVWDEYGMRIDGGEKATDVRFGRVTGIDIDAQGRVVFADRNGGRILRIEPDGTLTRVAGSILPTDSGHGTADGTDIAAHFEDLHYPQAIVAEDNGDILIQAAYGGERLHRVYASGGTIESIIDDCCTFQPFSGAAAPDLRLDFSTGLAQDDDGNVYVGATYGSDDVVKLYASGNTADNLAEGDMDAWDIEHHDGVLYISSRFDHQIWKMDDTGANRELVAGTGAIGNSGDGGPAVDALLGETRGLFVKNDGTILFSDSTNQSIRKIDTSGNISTVVEDATTIFDLVLDANGNIVATSHSNCDVRRIYGPF